MKRIIFSLLIIGSFPFQSQAWWDTGHMAVAMVAYQNLSPATRDWADQLIPVLQKHYKGTGSFVEAATWPDDIKGHGVGAYSPMHYTNIPFNPDNIALPANAQPDVDVVFGIKTQIYTLESSRAIPLEKAQALALLIHFVGDIHQPLHSTTMYTNEQPGGNRGGNDFKLDDPKHSNLHKLWDDGCGFFAPWEDKIKRDPLKEESMEALRAIADSLTRRWPESSLTDAANLDVDRWVMESHDLAVKYGYRGIQSVGDRGWKNWIKPGDAPTEMYIRAGQEVVSRQVATGGYRLARLLNDIHDRNTNK